MEDSTSNPPTGEQPTPPPAKKKLPAWVRILTAIAGLIVIVCGLLQWLGNGHDVQYDKDDIHYYHDATHADADALAKALKDAGYFGNASGVTVLLDKKGDEITLSFVVDPQKVNDPAIQKDFHDVAVGVAKSISGQLVGIKLVDSDLNVKQTIGV
jgi:hypothetical protein